MINLNGCGSGSDHADNHGSCHGGGFGYEDGDGLGDGVGYGSEGGGGYGYGYGYGYSANENFGCGCGYGGGGGGGFGGKYSIENEYVTPALVDNDPLTLACQSVCMFSKEKDNECS